MTTANYRAVAKVLGVGFLLLVQGSAVEAQTKKPAAKIASPVPKATAPAAKTTGPKKWAGQIPKLAEDSKAWRELLQELKDAKLYYGQLAASARLITFFSDLETKEFAYRNIVDLIDQGYPFPTRKLFIPGDIEPVGEDGFQDSYNLYKAMANVEKKTDKWAQFYFGKLNKEKSPKYLFYQAIELYQQKKLPEAVTILLKLVESTKDPTQVNFIKKVTRTLARIYYEMGDFEKAASIYMSFILKTNPVTPSDYMEAAWAFYRMGQYDSAMGVLYNMESKAAHHLIFLEKYIIRALIYRDYCGINTTAALIESFEREFGKVIDAIKMGEPLKVFALLPRIEHPETQEYRQVMKSIDELTQEREHISQIDGDVQDLASYLYDSELKALKRQKGLYEEAALEVLANHLVILGESLRFLKFDVAREKFNPDRVFREVEQKSKILVEDVDDTQFRIRWTQAGDFWRDERLNYKGLVRNICDDPEPIPGNEKVNEFKERPAEADVQEKLDQAEEALE